MKVTSTTTTDSKTTVTIQYDGKDAEDPTGDLKDNKGLNLDLSGQGRFCLNMMTGDDTASVVARVTTRAGINNTSPMNFSSGADFGNFYIPFTKCNGSPNFSNVQTIEFTIRTTGTTMYTICGITAVPVPEPSTVVATFLGVAAVGSRACWRNRRRIA